MKRKKFYFSFLLIKQREKMNIFICRREELRRTVKLRIEEKHGIFDKTSLFDT